MARLTVNALVSPEYISVGLTDIKVLHLLLQLRRKLSLVVDFISRVLALQKDMTSTIPMILNGVSTDYPAQSRQPQQA